MSEFLYPPVVTNVSTLPTAGVKGRVVLLTTDNKFYGDNGTTWVDLTGGALAGYTLIGTSTLRTLNKDTSTFDNVLDVLATVIADATIAAGGFAGEATVNFGTTGKTDAFVAVTGQPAISTSSVIIASIAYAATTDHSADEHLVEEIKTIAGNIVAGTGFTIYAQAARGLLYGQWKINWRWS